MRRPVVTRMRMIVGVLALLGICAPSVWWFRSHRPADLPYHDSFVRHTASEWTPYGGAWQLDGDTILNRSDERGAKLIAGSSRWKDYQISTDLKLVGHGGDVGIIVRAGDAEHGIDAYNGYYVGLRSADTGIVIGRADYGWMEARPVPIRGGLHKGQWYHLRVVAVGCNIGAELTAISSGESTWAAFHEPSCVASGKIGLRSMDTGGAWRHVEVRSATMADWQEIRSRASFLGEPVYPMREADYDSMREQYFSSTGILPAGNLDAVNRQYQPDPSQTNAPQIKPIASIASMPSQVVPVMLRGVVTLINPLYVQDATGGIAVKVKKPVPLNLGDEVEVSGVPAIGSFHSEVIARNVRLLWDRTLVLPIAVTSTQAATGAFNSSLVEVSGILRSRSMDRNGLISLELYDSAQRFRATVRGGISAQQYTNLSAGSRLRISGICIAGAPAASNGAAFTVLLRSMEDVEVLAGPPWWTGRQLHRLVAGVFALAAFGVFIYMRLERAKLQAILNERERLAHDMHDTLAQSFAGVGYHLQAMRNYLRNGTLDEASMLAKLDTACEIVANTHREASATIAALHPAEGEGDNLLIALERSARSMLDAEVIPLSFVELGAVRPISLPVRDALFQIGREAITNVLHHSGATWITVTLRYEPKRIALQVCDNGRGFNPAEQASGFGIRTMRRRAREIAAVLNMESKHGAGTVLQVEAPYGCQLTLLAWLRSQAIACACWLRIRFRLPQIPGSADDLRSVDEKS